MGLRRNLSRRDTLAAGVKNSAGESGLCRDFVGIDLVVCLYGCMLTSSACSRMNQ